MVSWNNCQDFIENLNKLTGKKFRLPTEAEWEFAARGGHKNESYWALSGSNEIDDVAWYLYNSDKHTHAVALKQPNALGIYDMSGNVAEWCADWYGEDYYTQSALVNPTGPATGTHRVTRGGAWANFDTFCCVWERMNFLPTETRDILGFRLALTSSK